MTRMGYFFSMVLFSANLSHGVAPSDPASLRSSGRATAPHVAALRQQLGLSSHLELQWIASNNGMDTLRVTDNFNRSQIGDDWALDDSYWAIKNGELVLTAAAIYEWRYLAVFKPIFNTSGRQIYSVAYRWGKNAETVAIGEGAHALMIDAPSYEGSGYWCWRRTNQNSVWLYAIKDGTWEYTPGESKEYHRASSHLPIPRGGDYIEAVIFNQPEAVYFDYYINGSWDATVRDQSKEFAQNSTWYAGVFIHGQDLNNQVDDFTITWLSGDNVPPAATTDLHASDSSAASVTLAWTAPGDNDFEGRPDRLEIRYATTLITTNNFSSATLAANLPSPAEGGESQQFVVTGLNPNTQYYFALRAFDEVSNAGDLSNVTSAHTRGNGVAQSFQLAGECGQSGVVGTALPEPVRVQILDEDGFPVAGYVVDFVVTAGGGKIDGDSEVALVTNDEGIAEVIWTLGTIPGENKLEIIAAGLQNSPVRCSATALIGPAKELTTIAGNQQLLSPQTLSDPLIVKLADAYGNGIADASVTFSITSGSGSFVNSTSSNGKKFKTRTDSSGQAGAQFRAGKNYGDSTKISAKMDNNNNVTAALFAVATTKPDSLRALSGNGQTAQPGKTLPQPVVVKIIDQLGVAVPNYAVQFKVIGGNGSLPDDSTTKQISTDSSGRASTSWIIGLGNNQLEASASSLQGSPLIFTATGIDSSSAVGERNGELPRQFALLPNAPNPFNPATTIYFELPQNAEVVIEIFDLSGRQLRTLFASTLAPGLHRLQWDGRDANGRSLDSGVYFCRMRARTLGKNEMHVATRKLTLAK